MNIRRRTVAILSLVVIASFLFGSVMVAVAPEDTGLDAIWDAIFGLEQDVEELQTQSDLEAQIEDLEEQIDDLKVETGTLRELLDFLEEQWIPGPEGPQGEQGPIGPQGEPGLGFGTSGVITVPAAQFVRETKDTDIENLGIKISNNDTVDRVWCFAGVQLPQGATISQIIFVWFDNNPNGPQTVDCYLIRWQTELPVNQIMAEATSNHSDGFGISYSSSVDYAEIDNNAGYTYYLAVEIPPVHLGEPSGFYYVLIQYDYLP